MTKRSPANKQTTASSLPFEDVPEGSKAPAAKRRSRKTSKVSEGGRETRQNIIDAGRSLLMEKGYSQFRLLEVAQRAGLGIGNLPYYFPTKTDLIHAILDEASARDIERLHSATSAAATMLGKLNALVDAALTVIDTPENSVWLTISELARHDRKLAEKIAFVDENFSQEVAKELMLIRPNLEPKRAQHIALFFTVTLNGFGMAAQELPANTHHLVSRQDVLKSELRAVMAMLVLERYIDG